MQLDVGILVFPRVQQLDVTGPYEVFASVPGATVHLLAKEAGTVTASSRMILGPTIAMADCPRLDVFCVPGGDGVNALLQDAEVLAFVRAQAARCRYITSVCTGALLLGAAGLLDGRRATTHWAAHDLLAAFGAIPVHERVVRDGNLITGGGVTAGIDFALTVVTNLGPAEFIYGVGMLGSMPYTEFLVTGAQASVSSAQQSSNGTSAMGMAVRPAY